MPHPLLLLLLPPPPPLIQWPLKPRCCTSTVSCPILPRIECNLRPTCPPLYPAASSRVSSSAHLLSRALQFLSGMLKRMACQWRSAHSALKAARNGTVLKKTRENCRRLMPPTALSSCRLGPLHPWFPVPPHSREPAVRGARPAAAARSCFRPHRRRRAAGCRGRRVRGKLAGERVRRLLLGGCVAVHRLKQIVSHLLNSISRVCDKFFACR